MLRNKTHNAQKNTDLDIRFVRATFVSRGDSLHAWADRNGFNPTHVLRSIRGDYAGPKALKTICALRKDLAL